MMSSPATRARARLREDTIARLRAVLAEHPPLDGTERVILFGSLARGDFDGASDADLLVVGGDGTLDASIWDAVGERDCDIIPWTREAWAHALAGGHPFAADISREGVELWRAPGVAPLRGG
jgi:predicted nucleotidyltransferase